MPRKAVPIAVKTARAGGATRDPVSHRPVGVEPPAAQGYPDPPKKIRDNPDALEAWNDFAAEIGPMNLATKADRASLAMLAWTWALYANDAEKLGNQSVIKWPNGMPGPSPYVKTYHQHAALISRLLNDFGLSPTARARFSTPKVEAKPDDNFDDLDG